MRRRSGAARVQRLRSTSTGSLQSASHTAPCNFQNWSTGPVTPYPRKTSMEKTLPKDSRAIQLNLATNYRQYGNTHTGCTRRQKCSALLSMSGDPKKDRHHPAIIHCSAPRKQLHSHATSQSVRPSRSTHKRRGSGYLSHNIFFLWTWRQPAPGTWWPLASTDISLR